MRTWIVPALLATLCWGVYAFIPKITVKNINPQSAIFYEALGGLVVGIIILVFSGYTAQAKLTGLILALITGAFFFLHAVNNGKSSLVVTITSLYPIVTLTLTFLILGEKITIQQFIGVIFALISIFLIS